MIQACEVTMKKLFLQLTKFVLVCALKLRYRIIVRNKELLSDSRFNDKGLLVLPNHPAEVDPFIMLVLLGLPLKLRPLVSENFFHYPGASMYMRALRAMSVTDFDKSASRTKLKQADDLLRSLVDDLKKGDHFLIYPGAQLKRSPDEKIGGRSLAYNAIQAAPETEILLVRISGLWGSLFSTAFTGITPDFWSLIKKAIGIVFKNGIFFAPRRRVTVDLSTLPEGFPKQGTKSEFNRALEAFYNQYEDEEGRVHAKEPLTLVPHTFWSRKLPDTVEKREVEVDDEEFLVPGHIRQDIVFQLSEMSGKSVKDIKDNDDLVFDVGLDSINIAAIYSHIDNHYELDSSIQPVDLKRVNDLFRAAMHISKDRPRAGSELRLPKTSWPKEGKRPVPKHAAGETIPEVFLNNANLLGKFTAAVDQTSGVLTYKRAKLGVVILAREIAKLEGKYVGIMLPSTTGVYLLILACHLAGKIPVTLNWTVGPYFMNHALELTKLSHVITSEKFVDRLENVDIGNTIDKLLFIEDIRKKLTLGDKIKGAFIARKSTAKLLKHFGVENLSPDETCIVLFTSGTTALPKAVPLTHRNILSNQKAALKAIDLFPSDILMMVLPPFHVFGFTLGILAFLTGVRSVFSPDPLDGATIGKQILKWHATVAIMAPTFFSHLFRSASLSQLKSLRVFISGAEKAPATIREFVAKLGSGTWFLEGYGLTETSPIISVNFMNQEPRGVGKVVESCDIVIREPVSGRIGGPHEVGEICVTGPSVFKGYLEFEGNDIFVDINGKSYYRTGDLGYLDEEGYLYLEGRIKQTLKRGGEMINLTAIETVLFDKAKSKKWVTDTVAHTPFACVPKDLPNGQARVVLFSEIELSLDQVNKTLIEAGFSRLYKVNEVIKIEASQKESLVKMEILNTPYFFAVC